MLATPIKPMTHKRNCELLDLICHLYTEVRSNLSGNAELPGICHLIKAMALNTTKETTLCLMGVTRSPRGQCSHFPFLEKMIEFGSTAITFIELAAADIFNSASTSVDDGPRRAAFTRVRNLTTDDVA